MEAKLTNILNIQKSNLKDKKNQDVYIYNFLEKSKWMNLLTEDLIESMGHYIKMVSYNNETIIKPSNSLFDSIIYVKKGQLLKYKDESRQSNVASEVIPEGSLIGEKEFFLNITPDYIVATDPNYKTTLLSLGSNFIKVFLSKQFISFVITDIFRPRINQIMLENSNLISFIGMGSYGCVNLINHNKQLYALKSLSKSKLRNKPSMINYIINEKQNLYSFSSPFILRLEATDTDDYFCHFITEYIKGIPLDEVIKRKITYLKAKECLFYFYNLIVILESLRLKCVVHRDIKPANIIVQQNGYLKLIDFGLSKKLKDFTYTIIGSPYFIAPEVIKGFGYGRFCDYWALGISLYKMYYNKYPFGEECNTAIEVYKDISDAPLSFPFTTDKDSINIKTVIKIMLNRNVTSRPASLKQLTQVLPFKIKWSDFVNMNSNPPFIPSNDYTNLYKFYNADDNQLLSKANADIIEAQGVSFNPRKILDNFNKDKVEKIEESDDIFGEF